MTALHRGSIALTNARIHTLDQSNAVAQAISIVDGRIRAVGSESEVSPFIGEDARIVDVSGRTVLPGFIDAHTHIELGAYAGGLWVNVRDKTPEETIEVVAAEVLKRPGEWVIAQGTFGQVLPSRADLDTVAPSTPVLVRESMHILQANSTALRLAGIGHTTMPNAASRLERDARGEPTGKVEEGFDLFPVPYPDEHKLISLLQEEVTKSFVQHGVTTAHELPATAAAVRAWQTLAGRGELPLRLSLNFTVAPGHQPLLRSVADLTRLGLRTGFGGESLKVGALKMFLDGDEAAAFTGRQLQGAPRSWGLVTHTYTQLLHILSESFEAGVQVWIHCIGDAAQEMALDAIEAVAHLYPDYDHRTRLEHISCECSDWDQVDRMLSAGIIPVPTAAFMYALTDPEEELSYFIYRSLLGAGHKPPGNSDSAGSQPFATNPWFSISCLLNRRNKLGREVSPDERIDLESALRIHTVNGAYAAFEEKEKGTLEVGKLGDLVVVDEDPFGMDPEAIADVRTTMTVVGGTVVYEQP